MADEYTLLSRTLLLGRYPPFIKSTTVLFSIYGTIPYDVILLGILVYFRYSTNLVNYQDNSARCGKKHAGYFIYLSNLICSLVLLFCYMTSDAIPVN